MIEYLALQQGTTNGQARCTGERVLRFVPPLIITQMEIDRLLDTLAQIFSNQAA